METKINFEELSWEQKDRINNYIYEKLSEDFDECCLEMYGDIFKIMPCHYHYENYYLDEICLDTHLNLINDFYYAVKDAIRDYGILNDALEKELDKAHELFYNYYNYTDSDVSDEEVDFVIDTFNEAVDEINEDVSSYSRGQYIDDLYKDELNRLLNEDFEEIEYLI